MFDDESSTCVGIIPHVQDLFEVYDFRNANINMNSPFVNTEVSALKLGLRRQDDLISWENDFVRSLCPSCVCRASSFLVLFDSFFLFSASEN